MTLNPRTIFKNAGPLFVAIGEPHRQHIILLLCEHQALGVGALTKSLNISRPAVSHHLKVLLGARLIKMQRMGTQRIYSLDVRDGIAVLKQFVTAIEQSKKYKEGRL